MPTTNYTTPTMSVNVIGARTDAAGAAVTDTTAEEARFPAVGFTEGYITPSTAFKVAAQTSPDMTVKVGSGTSKADYYVISGEVAGQGNYIARLDVTSQNVTIDAADASQTRTDEIYLVVRDNPYDASSRALPQFGYRKGDLGGANPGPDAAWRASALLARIVVGAAVTSITNANITDMRSGGSAGGIPPSTLTTKGDLLVATAPGIVTRQGVGTNGYVFMADSAQSAGVKWAAPVVAASNYVSAFEDVPSSSYSDLATAGPAVTLTVGPLGIAVVSFKANGWNPATDGDQAIITTTVALSGSNTVAASDENSAQSGHQADDTGGLIQYLFSVMSATIVFTGLTPGSTTFTMKYKVVEDTIFSSHGVDDRKLGVVTF